MVPRPDPDKPHFFRPRKYGNHKACEVCGGVRANMIHIDSRRNDGS